MALTKLQRNSLLIVTVPAILLSALWFLSSVFKGRVILPAVFHLGPLTVHYYGLILGLAVLSGVWLAQSRLERYRLTAMEAERIFVYLILGGFIGARFYHILTAWQFYQAEPLRAFMVWRGGLSIYGAILGGLVSLLIYAYRVRQLQSLGYWLDWLAPSVALGQAIGRFGNLFNYEAFGVPSAWPWPMYVPAEHRPMEWATVTYFTPLFLYESLGLGLIVIALLYLSGKKTPSGTLFLSLLLMYNTLRIFTESLRIDSVMIGNIRLNMVVSGFIVLIATSGILYIYGQKNPRHH